MNTEATTIRYARRLAKRAGMTLHKLRRGGFTLHRPALVPREPMRFEGLKEVLEELRAQVG